MFDVRVLLFLCADALFSIPGTFSDAIDMYRTHGIEYRTESMTVFYMEAKTFDI